MTFVAISINYLDYWQIVLIIMFWKSQDYEVHRNNIPSSLNDNCKHFSSETAPENSLLFGSDLEGVMKNVETNNRQSKKLADNNQSRKIRSLRK